MPLKKKISMFVNIDKYFFSHRLPIAQAAKKNDFEMTVYAEFTQTNKDTSINDFNLLNSPLKRSSKSIFSIMLELFKAYRLIKKDKPSLIHAVTIRPILILGIIARFTSIPFIGSFAGLGPVFTAKSYGQKIRLFIILRVLKFIFSRNNSGIICQNTSDRSLLEDFGVASKKDMLLIRGSGVNLEKFSPLKKRNTTEKYILMSSRILLDKGIKEYCLAAKKVRQKFGNEIKFKLSGMIDSFSSSGMSQNAIDLLTKKYGVEYLGDREDMPELLASAMIFVLPSYYPEGLPKVLLEAAASGVAIITTDHHGCRDAIIDKETGLLIKVKNHESLVIAITKLIENPTLLKDMGKKARKLAENSFADSDVVDKHFSLYKQLT